MRLHDQQLEAETFAALELESRECYSRVLLHRLRNNFHLLGGYLTLATASLSADHPANNPLQSAEKTLLDVAKAIEEFEACEAQSLEAMDSEHTRE